MFYSLGFNPNFSTFVNSIKEFLSPTMCTALFRALVGHPSKSHARRLLSESLHSSGAAVGRDGAVNKLIHVSAITVLEKSKQMGAGLPQAVGGWLWWQQGNGLHVGSQRR